MARSRLSCGNDFFQKNNACMLEDVRREATRPKVGNLFGKPEEALRRFLKKYYPNIQKLRDVKDGRRLMKILDQFEEYWKKEFWEEESKSL